MVAPLLTGVETFDQTRDQATQFCVVFLLGNHFAEFRDQFFRVDFHTFYPANAKLDAREVSGWVRYAL